MNYKEKALKLHKELKGKIEISTRADGMNQDLLPLLYTPGVADVCLEIEKDPFLSYTYTRRGNLIAIITDGTAVLGLGDIGPVAAMPVMEGKALLFKTFGDVDAIPIVLDTKDPEEIIKTIKYLAPTFAGINLEDISAPRCFEIEKRLKEELDIPVFHDDQHGTAIVVGAAVLNSLVLTNRNMKEAKIVINGAGAAGISISRHLLRLGAKNIVLCDRFGILNENQVLNQAQKDIMKLVNKENLTGTLSTAMKGSDIFIGVSVGNVVTKEMVKSMNEKAIIFAVANPIPEIMPEDAKEAGAYIIGTGRSDYPNQINNLLVFPGVFRGVLDVLASDVNDEMMVAASLAIANSIPQDQLSCEYIIPSAFDKSIHERVAKAISATAIKCGLARQ